MRHVCRPGSIIYKPVELVANNGHMLLNLSPIAQGGETGQQQMGGRRNVPPVKTDGKEPGRQGKSVQVLGLEQLDNCSFPQLRTAFRLPFLEKTRLPSDLAYAVRVELE